MKRLLAAILTVACLLSGCSEEIGESVPNAPETESACISIRELTAARDYGLFTAGVPDASSAQAARELVESALALYPAGFAEQWGPVEIWLAGALTGEDAFSHGSYAGFTQRSTEGWTVVLDVTACDAGTVHHEIAHILDGILTEAGALTGEEWRSYCPDGFVYGQPDREGYADFFADAYAMENIKEDRARTFEDAMLYGPGAYDDRPALWLKLACFSRAIRDHFDTAGWPEKTLWELALA